MTSRLNRFAGFCFHKVVPARPAAALAGMALASILACQSAQATTPVPPGNRNIEQPAVPGASARRTGQLNTTFEAKYRKIYNLLKADTALRSKIRSTASAYGIDPLHIVGAIVGEHTYNVDVYDRIQTYYVKAMSYVSQGVSFRYNGEGIEEFVNRPEFARCEKFSDSYSLWTCRENIWNSKFRGKTVNGKSYPNNRFSAVFFQPFYAGQTFGLGQINPLTALMMSDIVNRVSGLPKLDAANGNAVYRTIMDPDLTLPYIAATLKQSITAYRRIADFDISRNPGITATLYNTGGAEERARILANTNAKRKAAGKELLLPQENYYGWLVNAKLDELRPLF
ncbi:DUF1402 family protein [Falsochrobactrum sp. TDYN1]|uniref:DUF1402 family protein n=1 Tax=Falsochrobactrum tianjinense TaxID=2706015 RepID=A0A949PJN4_9HYPH|nr:DUF1402 family protein [Falsochrobactrum sp. TDYN1]MBV2142042.1 DUF1402 family protein [Falsochrobactrum sp. TDYN1]